jgi:hypothetical protein
VPIQFTWFIGLLLMSQSALWAIPFGLVGLGLFNVVAAICLTLWLATWSIDSERRAGTLEVLLTTTLPTWRIAIGKLAGIALPTAPLIALSLPLLVFGTLYANVLMEQGGDVIGWTSGAIGAWFWSASVWLASLSLGMLIALISKKRSAFAISIGLVGTTLGVPTVVGRLFPDIWWLAGPARLLAPPLAGDPSWWQLLLSWAGMSVLALLLFIAVSRNLRHLVSAGLALLALGLTPSIAAAQDLQAQDEFYLVAHALADGHTREAQWTAIAVSVVNAGRSAQGTIRLIERIPGSGEDIPYERQVELPEGARKDLLLMVRPGSSSRVRTVSLTTNTGRIAEAEVPLSTVDGDGHIIGVIGNDALGLTAMSQSWVGPIPGDRPRGHSTGARTIRAGLVDPRLMPRHSAAWEAMDQVVWHRPDPSQVGGRELDALINWVAGGGHLVLTVSDTWNQVSNSALAETLPVDLIGTRDTDLGDLLMVLDGANGDNTTAPQVMAVPRKTRDRGTWVMAEDDQGYALWSIGSYGLGTVTVLAADPLIEPLSKVDRIGLWRRLLWLPPPGIGQEWVDRSLAAARGLPSESGAKPSLRAALRTWDLAGTECFWTGGDTYGSSLHWRRDGWEHDVRERLSDIPGASPLPLSWLLAFSVLYLIVIGPMDFLMLRWMRRQPWTWVTFPMTVLVFSGAALFGTAYNKGSQAVVTRVEIIDLLPGTDRWRGQTHLGVFATRKTELSLTSGSPDGIVSPLREPGFLGEPRVHTREGPGALSWHAETWTLAYARSTWVEGGHGRFRLVEDELGLYIENATGLDLTEVVLLKRSPEEHSSSPHVHIELGPLNVGERARIDLDDWDHGTPGDDDLRWAWRTLLDGPEDVGAHLHLHTWDLAVVAIAAEPVEPLVLTGLEPISKPFTLLRAPLGPPTEPQVDPWIGNPSP